MELIGIAGAAGSGKNTAADYLISRMAHFQIMAFGDTLKHMITTGLGLDNKHVHGGDKERVLDEYGVSPRHMMQTLGTDWGREMINENIWVIAFHQRRARYVIAPDVRFENEATYIRAHGGRVIHIEGRGGIEGNHASEDGVAVAAGLDSVVDNSGTLLQFHAQLAGCFPDLGGVR